MMKMKTQFSTKNACIKIIIFHFIEFIIFISHMNNEFKSYNKKKKKIKAYY